MSQGSTLHVDCDSCSARGPACTDCVVTVLLGIPGPRVDLDGDEKPQFHRVLWISTPH